MKLRIAQASDSHWTSNHRMTFVIERNKTYMTSVGGWNKDYGGLEGLINGIKGSTTGHIIEVEYDEERTIATTYAVSDESGILRVL